MKGYFQVRNISIFFLAQISCLNIFARADQNASAGFDNYVVDRLSIEYGHPLHSAPSLAPLADAYIFLKDANKSVHLEELFTGSSEIKNITSQDLKTIFQVPVQFLKSLGYEGIVAFADPSQIDPLSGVDLRDNNQSDLRILVWLSRVDELSWDAEGITNERFTKLRFKAQESLPNLLVGEAFLTKEFKLLKRLENSSTFDAEIKITGDTKPGFIVPEITLKSRKKDRFKTFAMNAGTESTGTWLLGASYERLDLTQNDDTFDISLLSSDSAKRASFSAGYYIPLIFPDLLSVGTRASYSFYDATSFAFEEVDFDGSTKSLNMWLDWKPLATESSNQSLSFQSGLTLETLKPLTLSCPGKELQLNFRLI